jgi:hypothetical protein
MTHADWLLNRSAIDVKKGCVLAATRAVQFEILDVILNEFPALWNDDQFVMGATHVQMSSRRQFASLREWARAKGGLPSLEILSYFGDH